jgi:hypothetical protein
MVNFTYGFQDGLFKWHTEGNNIHSSTRRIHSAMKEVTSMSIKESSIWSEVVSKNLVGKH